METLLLSCERHLIATSLLTSEVRGAMFCTTLIKILYDGMYNWRKSFWMSPILFIIPPFSLSPPPRPFHDKVGHSGQAGSPTAFYATDFWFEFVWS